MADALWRLGVTEEQLKTLPVSTQRFLREAAENVEKWSSTLEKQEADILADRTLSTLGRQESVQKVRDEHRQKVEELLSRWSNVFDQAQMFIKSDESERRTEGIMTMRKTLGDHGAGEVIRQRIGSMDGNSIAALMSDAQRLGSDWEVEATRVHAFTLLLEREAEEKRLIGLGVADRRGRGLQQGDRDLLESLRPENFTENALNVMNGVSGTLRKSMVSGGDNLRRENFAQSIRQM